ncbi:phospholipase D/nuclease [Clavulina sp. PMI_390]|nr:phospholipase D/nuclease [Clavulina sp. PMI_390]
MPSIEILTWVGWQLLNQLFVLAAVSLTLKTGKPPSPVHHRLLLTLYTYRHYLAFVRVSDEIQKMVNASHRFESFAAQRKQCTVKWHITGHDYFWAVSEMLDSAEECIFILDWWLSPELYLRRPPAYHEEWRLDRLLLKKAQQGVRVFIVVYNEVKGVATMNSDHTQDALEKLHENIRVMRHPEHFSLDISEDVFFWSHHEKVVVVDNHKACIGGLDLCYGRWDTQSHPLADVHPTEFRQTLFPGQDYNNARTEDFKQVNNFLTNEFSILDQPRMPWQDVHMTLIGPAVLDITQHFIERWNFVKVSKYRLNPRYDYLAFPHDISESSAEAIKLHRHFEFWQMKGLHWIQRWFGKYTPPDDLDDESPNGTCHVQVVRSSSKWSHGIETEHSIQNAYIQLIKEAKHFIYIENQFFVSNPGKGGDAVKNRIAEALVERILQAAAEGKKFRVMVCMPEVPAFAGSVQSGSISNILAAQYRTMNRGGASIYETIAQAGYNPMDYIRFYHLRTYDRINGPASFIQSMEQKSQVSFEQAQVALVRMWLGSKDDADAPQSIEVKIPKPSQNSISIDRPHMRMKSSEGDDSGGKPKADSPSDAKDTIESKHVMLPRTFAEAAGLVSQFERAAPRSDDDVADTVGQHVQLDRTVLTQEKWLGTEEEERDAYVSEEVYIHTKCMIVDDMKVIMGSANLNDRSMCGDRDSEIALVVEDTHMIPSRMDGEHYQAALFAATLRRKLFRKHLGYIEPQFCESKDDPVTPFMRPSPIQNPNESAAPGSELVVDPLSDDFFDHWNAQAKSNTEIYQELFHTVPSNSVKNWDAMKTWLPVVKPGHLADPSVSHDTLEARLTNVKGHLVEAQLDFLIEEKEWTSSDNLLWAGLDPVVVVVQPSDTNSYGVKAWEWENCFTLPLIGDNLASTKSWLASRKQNSPLSYNIPKGFQRSFLSSNSKDISSLLPVEIMAHIFLAGLETFGRDYWADDETSTALLRFLLTLASVSSRWRAIAISTPLLWAKIVIGHRKPWTRNWIQSEHTLNRVSAQLGRSQQASLEITLHARPYLSNLQIKGHVGLWLSTVEDHLSRCHTLRLLAVSQYAAAILPLPGPLHQCRQLFIEFSFEEASGVPLPTRNDAPRLERLTVRIFEPTLLSAFPVQQLACLKLDRDLWTSSDYQSLLPILSSAFSLIELELLGQEADEFDSLEPITLPALQKLHVEGPKFISLIQAPKLYHLRCSHDGVVGLMAFSTSSLTQLVLSDIRIAYLRRWMLSSYISMEVLVLNGWGRDALEIILHHLFPFKGQNYFPALRALRILPNFPWIPRAMSTACISQLESIMNHHPNLRLECLPGMFPAPFAVKTINDQVLFDRIVECEFAALEDWG